VSRIERNTVAQRYGGPVRVPEAVLEAQRRVLAGELTARQANRTLGVRPERLQTDPDRAERRERALGGARKRVDRYRALLEA
jgi:hypothetical protein